MVGVLCAASLLETVGVSLIYPFMQLVTDRSILNDNEYFHYAYTRFDFESYERFIFVSGIVVIVTIIAINVMIMISRWAIFKFTCERFHDVQKTLMQSYLAHDYEFFLSRDASEMSKNLLTEVGIAVSGFLLPLVDAMSRAVSVVLIVSVMGMIDPVKTLLLIGIIILIYGIISMCTGRLTLRFGSERRAVHENLYKCTTEIFGGVKLIKSKGIEAPFLEKFKQPSFRYAELNMWVTILSILPRYIIEATFMAAAVLFVLTEIQVAGSLQKVSLFGIIRFFRNENITVHSTDIWQLC